MREQVMVSTSSLNALVIFKSSVIEENIKKWLNF